MGAFDEKMRDAYYAGKHGTPKPGYDHNLTSQQNREVELEYEKHKSIQEYLDTLDDIITNKPKASRESGPNGLVAAMVIAAICLVGYGIYASVTQYYNDQTGGIRLLLQIGWRLVAGIATGLLVAFVAVKVFRINPGAGWFVATIVAIPAVIYFMSGVPSEWVMLYVEELSASTRFLIKTFLVVFGGLFTTFIAFRFFRLRGVLLFYTALGSCIILALIVFLLI